MKNKTKLSKRDLYLEKIYGEWFNLVAAGTLFITYAVFAVCYQLFLQDVITFPYILERYPGAILVIMGFFFSGNAIWLRTKKHVKNNVLLARGIFDLLSGIMILIMPKFGMMMTMIVMGLALIHIGIRFLTDADSNLTDFILSVILIPVGVSDIDVINYIVPYNLRVLIFAVFLGCLGIFLIYISKSYRKATKGIYVR